VNRWLDGLRGLPGVRVSHALVRLGPGARWTCDATVDALWAHEPRIAVPPDAALDKA
jgi:hypothetical protein